MRSNRKLVVPLLVALTAVLAAAVLSGCTYVAGIWRGVNGAYQALSPSSVRPSGTLTGTVAFVERVAIPADARVTVQLTDTSSTEDQAVVLAEHRFISAGRQVPLPFELTYDPAAIDPRATYTVQARIEIGGQLRWQSENSYAVLTGGAPATGLAVELAKVDPTAASAPPTGLEGRNWRLASFGAAGKETAVPEGVEVTAAFSGAASQVAGHAGCNTYFATFLRDAGKLTISKVGSTRMACAPELMAIEGAFLQALKTATEYSVEGDQLQILYDDGKGVASFVLQ